MENVTFLSLRKTAIKVVRLRKRIDFLEDCRHFDLIPNFMKVKNKTLMTEYNKDVKNFERKLLKKIIRRQYSEVARLKRREEMLSEQLQIETDRENVEIYERKLIFYRETERKRCTER